MARSQLVGWGVLDAQSHFVSHVGPDGIRRGDWQSPPAE
jgi:hypothetical protein